VIDNITTDTTLSPSSCAVYTPACDVNVREGATLTIEAGTEIRFAEGCWLHNEDGTLLLNGTADDPIVLRSVTDDADPGSWIGVIASAASARTTLSFVTVADAGQDTSGGDGCLTVDAGAGHVDVADSTFTNCDRVGVASGEPFDSFSRNTITTVTTGLRLSPDTVGSITEPVTLTGVERNEILFGSVTRTATWLSLGVPWVLDSDVEVEGASNPALTIAAGNELRFNGGSWLAIGRDAPGKLIVAGTDGAPVVFGAVDTGAVEGAWIGLLFSDNTLSGSTITHATIQQAGQELSAGHGCLTVSGANANTLSVDHTTFRLCATAGVAVVSDDSQFAAFADNAVSDSEVGLSMMPNVVGSLDTPTTFTNVQRNELRFGTVTRTATWPTESVDWTALGDVEVENAGAGTTTLTLTGGTYRFPDGAWFGVGRDGIGALNATNATFASTDPGATTASWIGLLFSTNTASSTLTNVTVRQAGQELAGGHGGITLIQTGAAVTIVSPTFANNEVSDVFVDCDSTPTLNDMGTAVIGHPDAC
jgi:hypothetical protein